MMRVVTNPVGLDLRIMALQKKLYVHLRALWSLSEEQYTCYGRVYRNRKTGQGYIPEVQVDDTSEYKEVLFDNAVVLQSFFGIGTSTKINGKQYQTDVHLIFFANLKTIYPTLEHRGDMEARRHVFEFLRRCHHGFEPMAEKTGVEAVLSDYPGKAKDGLIEKADMHPWHCFRFDLKITYDPMGRL